MALRELQFLKQSLDDTLGGGGGNNPTFFESAVGPGLGVAGGEVSARGRGRAPRFSVVGWWEFCCWFRSCQVGIHRTIAGGFFVSPCLPRQWPVLYVFLSLFLMAGLSFGVSE